MTAQVLGSGFKFVVQSLLGAELLFPDLRARVEAMDDHAWYDWSDYVETTRTLAALLDRPTVVRIGSEIMLAAREHLIAQGFSSPESLLSVWEQVVAANVRGQSPAQQAHTLHAHEGEAVVEYGDELPAALIEGYLRGAVLAFGRRVQSCMVQPVVQDGVPRLRCTIRWT